MSEKQYTYDEIFQRNIGIFTLEEQERIKNLKVAVAGAGGLGGPVAYHLARLGVGEIRLADPDKFEVSNLNRQYGAYIDTLGEFKSVAIAKELRRISPFLETEAITEPLDNNNLDKFLNGADCVIDGIDFFSPKAELLMHKKAREKNQWIFTCQGANNITSFISFDPKGMSLEEAITKNDKPDLGVAIKLMFPQLPSGASFDMIEQMILEAEKTGMHYIPSYSVIAPFNGAFVVEDMIKVIIRKQSPLVSFPDLYYVDLEKMVIKFLRSGEIYNE